jgi:replicative DNA helicase
MQELKLPPHDAEAEASCLASILLSRDALMRVMEILRPEDFYLDSHKCIFEAVRELDSKNMPVDLITVKQKLADKNNFDKAGGDSGLVSIYQTVSTSANAEYYAKRVRELGVRRKMIDVSSRIVEQCFDKTRETG